MAQPQVINGSIAIAANSTNDNVIASDNSLRPLLNAFFNAKAKFFGVISATGLRVDVGYAGKFPIQGSDLRVDTVFQDPNDMINGDWYVPMGAQLVIRAVNTTGGAITLRYRLVLEDLDELGIPLQPDTLIMQRGPVAIANGTTDQQLLDGLAYEEPPEDCELTVLMTASAAGLTASIFVEMDRISPPSVIVANNRVPTKPFDVVIDGIDVPANKKVAIPVTNNSGGALNVFWRTEMEQFVRR